VPRKRIPSYRLHRASGLAVVTIPALALGQRGRDVFLGKRGSDTSREKYRRILAELDASGSGAGCSDGLTVVELCVAYGEHVAGYYRKDGKPTSEVGAIISALRFLQRLYSRMAAAQFSPLKLKAVRQSMIEAGLARTTINHHIARIKQCFAWGVENELLPGSTHHALTSVKGLRKGRGAARETGPILPVPDCDIEAVEAKVPSSVATMIRLQRLTGMRPGEVVQIRTADVDTTGAVWLFRPASHKTEHHGKGRVVCLGPRAIEILRPLLRRNLSEFIFSPLQSEAERLAARAAARTTPLSCGNSPGTNRVEPEQRQRQPGERYTTQSYGAAIRRGCKRAGVQVWGPNRLRHTAATEFRREFGIESAQTTLGHSKLDTTGIYAERDLQRAINVAARVG
jgi:integrase